MSNKRRHCPFCGLYADQSFLDLEDHIKIVHRGKRPFHRVYKLTSPKGLAAYLDFLVTELPDIVGHHHYAELRALTQQKRIGWKSDAGQLIEKALHITIDSHIRPCTPEKCSLTYIDLNYENRWTGFTLSVYRCKKCRKSEDKGEVWHLKPYLDDLTWVPQRTSSSLEVSCITLELDPWRSWSKPFEKKCKTCHCDRIKRSDYSGGYPLILPFCIQWDFCSCGFTCL